MSSVSELICFLGFDCCEIEGMFGKVKGQKWRQDPPEKMLKWWEENKCEEIVEDKCKPEPRGIT